MERLQFMGSTLFIPIFLVSVGVLLEPKVMIDPKTLRHRAGVHGGGAGRQGAGGGRSRGGPSSSRWPEVGVMSGLSGSQAAATLATTLVGAKLGLFDTQTINAVLVVILASLVVTPAMVSFFGKRVSSVADEAPRWGRPCWSRSGATRRARRSRLAGRLATSDGGIVARGQLRRQDGAAARGCKRSAGSPSRRRSGWPRKVSSPGPLFRVAPSVPEGLLETILGENATLLVTEWRMRDRIAARQRGVRGAGRARRCRS